MQLIFAAVGNQNNNADDMDDVSTIIILAVYGGFFLAYYLIKIFFLLTLSRTLSQCHPRNQAMQPGMVWLNLIPLFEFVWQFVTVSRISQSLKDEFRDRGRRIHDDFGNGLGITTCCLMLFGLCCGLATLGAIGCGIAYWVKIADYKRQLESSSREDEWSDEDEEDSWDEEDDRPRRRRRETEDEEGDDRPRRSQRGWKFEDEEEDDRPRKRRTEYGDHDDEH
jgi:hypothetical protein